MKDYIAGLISGAITTIVVHPLDTLKVTMQYHSTHSISKAAKLIIQLNSIKGFYRGVSPQLFLQCTSQTLFYGSYSSCLRFLGSDLDNKKPISALHQFIAGSFGGLTQAFPSSILELLKIRLQTTARHQEANIYQVFRHLIETEGFRGLTRGLHATLWRDSPPYGIYMMIYDPLKTYLNLLTNNEYLGGFISGGTVGVISWTIACPVDICKSKQQGGHTNKNLYQCFIEIYRIERSIHAYFCGWTAIASRAFLLNALSLFIWDRARRWF